MGDFSSVEELERNNHQPVPESRHGPHHPCKAAMASNWVKRAYWQPMAAW